MKRNRYLSMIIMGIAVVIILIGIVFKFELFALILGSIVFFIGNLVSIDYRCPNCKKIVGREKAEYCPFCGKKLE